MKNIDDDRIESINRILDTLPKLNEKIDRINARIYAGGYTGQEFREMVSERSALIKAREQMERLAKEKYKLQLNEEHGEVITSGVVEL